MSVHCMSSTALMGLLGNKAPGTYLATYMIFSCAGLTFSHADCSDIHEHCCHTGSHSVRQSHVSHGVLGGRQ